MRQEGLARYLDERFRDGFGDGPQPCGQPAGQDRQEFAPLRMDFELLGPDRVAVVAFRGRSAEVVLAPTASTSLAEMRLRLLDWRDYD